MKDDWLNKNLREKLDDYDSPMDLENAWESLQAKRQPPKKKKRFFFFWLIFGLLAAGIGGSYLLSSSLSDHNSKTETITEADHLLENENQQFEKAKSSSILSKSKTTNELNDESNKVVKTKTIQNASKNISYENQVHSNYKESKSIPNANIPFSEIENNNIITSSKNLGFIGNSSTNSIFPQQEEGEKTRAIDSKNALKEERPMADLFLPSLEMRLLDLPQTENLEKLDALLSKSTCYVFTSSPMAKDYFTISAGYGIHSKGKVVTNENPLDVFSVNAFFEKRFRNRKIYLKTGFTFDQFVNSIEMITEASFTEQRDDQLITVNYFQNGDIENVFGTADVEILERTSSETFNRYQLLSIPMILGYDVISANKLSLQIEGGMARSIFGFYSGKTFDLIDSDLEKQGVWQGLYGLNFNYKTGSRIHIFTSLKGNYHFNKMGKSDQLDIEKFRFHQVQVGLRFKL